MKHSVEIYGEKLANILDQQNIFDDINICNIIAEYYSKSGYSNFWGDAELYHMRELSKNNCKTYCSVSLWMLGVPLTKMIRLSNTLNFNVLVFGVPYRNVKAVAKRINNISTKLGGTKCTLKVFGVKDKRIDLDKEVILQLMEWIENNTTPTNWKENVKVHTI